MKKAEDFIKDLIFEFESPGDMIEAYEHIDLTKDELIHLLKQAQIDAIEETVKLCTKNAEIIIKDMYSDSFTTGDYFVVRYNPSGIDGVYPEECTRHTVAIETISILNCAEILKQQL